MNWLLISCIASIVVALGLAFILAACWIGQRDDDASDYERQLTEGDCPWPIRERF